jgi:transcriptional regulator with XRE-family HTH domain
VPRSAQTNIDPAFWNRLRKALKYNMDARGVTQKALAADLGIDPTTLNNFLNGQSKSLGGLAVALACTLTDLACAGTKIGRIAHGKHPKAPLVHTDQQLILEFVGAVEFKRESKRTAIVLRRPTVRHGSVRLLIREIG